jgi:hypothetical protein
MYYHENIGMQLPRKNHSTIEISSYIHTTETSVRMDKVHLPEVNKVSRGIQSESNTFNRHC